MDRKSLELLDQLLKDQRDNISTCTEEELDFIIDSVNRDLYRVQLEDFMAQLDKAMPIDDEKAIDDFYDGKWTIMLTIGTKVIAVNVKNCATIYNAVYDGIDDIIKDEL